MRRFNELEKEHAGKGIHFVSAYVQFQSLETIEKSVADLKLTHPVALDGFFDSRFTAPLLCCVWVIGVDGKIVHAAQEGWEEAALKELKKVKYPRLGLSRVYSPLEPAAEAFGAARYAEAHKLASAVADSDAADKVIEQAEQLVTRIEDMRDTLRKRAEVHEICGRYELALACWSELAAHFKGFEDEPDAAKEIARIKALDDYEPEMKARRAYVALRLQIWLPFESAGDDGKKTIEAARNAAEKLKKFAEDNKERAIASSARDFQAQYEAWLKELEGE